jgi:hypothetical protein
MFKILDPPLALGMLKRYTRWMITIEKANRDVGDSHFPMNR